MRAPGGRSVVWLRASAAIALVISYGACLSPPRPAIRPPRAPAESHTESPEAFWVFADPQLNNVAGASTRSRTKMLDDRAVHAIRPPTVDLWSGHLLSAVVQHMKETPLPVFFLGDAANTSCTGEMVRFLGAMEGLPWFGVLGNHDGYYMGNLTFAADALENPADFTWQGACEYAGTGSPLLVSKLAQLEDELLGQQHSNAAQGTMTKAVAVWMFLDDLNRRTGLSRDPLDPGSWTLDGDYWVFDARGAYVMAGRSLTVRAIAAVGASATRKSDTFSRSWQAYLLQDVELPRGDHAILLDTSDYEGRPPSSRFSQLLTTVLNKCKFPGVCGRVSRHQAAKARELHREHGSTRFFLMGHHDWQSISVIGASNLKDLMSDENFMTYISGHMHYPTTTVGFGAGEQWELNVASITDWPMQFARVAYWAGHGYVDINVRSLPITPTPGTCAYSTESREEMDYGTVEKYVLRSLTIYEHMLGYATSLRCDSGAQERYPQAEQYLDEVRRVAQPSVDDKERRRVLASAIEYDRVVLGLDPDIVRRETDCALWASHLEGAKNKYPRMKLGDEIGSSGALFRVRTNPFRPVHRPALSSRKPDDARWAVPSQPRFLPDLVLRSRGAVKRLDTR